jgi:2-polyprenyl-6-hydroxyphenyl methylase/3-demethylubiquinone-9 3-methyltransferase
MTLTDRESHFEFGQNWRDYAKTIDRARIASAVEGLQKLFPSGLSDKSFLDIGCGSGLHSLAALSLGASSVLATDIDENSVSTTRAVLSGHFPEARWTAEAKSIFDMAPQQIGTYDVVYSWGVLHHTGDMWRAIETAAKMVKPGGQFALAIYSTTALDPVWKVEKRIYSKGPRALQWATRQAFITALFFAQLLRGRNPVSLVSRARARGMNFSHDVHDWLGGYPYEAATAGELHDRVCSLGFLEERSFRIPPSSGIFGSGCHEFVFKRI